jgi:apolipoprotein N-acyltransferase
VTNPEGEDRGDLLPARLLLALGGGVLIAAAFPTSDRWYAAWLGCALLSAAGWAAGFRRGLLIGLFGGLAYFIPTLSWSGVYVGRLPWFALATLEALYVALMVGLTGWLQRRLLVVGRVPGMRVPGAQATGGRVTGGRVTGGRVTGGRVAAAYAVVPLAWVVQEWARSTTPFGGFPWARLAFSQADAPIRTLMSVGGAPLLTAAVATIGVLIHAAVRESVRSRPSVGAGAAFAAVAIALWPLLIPVGGGGPGAPTARIELVQGNVPKPGLDFNAERRAVLDNHVRETEAFAAQAGPVDLVVWPENAADIDPLRNADAAADIITAMTAVRAPLLLGAVLDEPAPYVSNASLLYRPGQLEPERYVKQHPVPFAEYVPYKDFFRRFSDKVDLVRYGMATGTRIGYFELTTAASHPGDPRTFAALPTICFEVAYDGLVRASVTHQPDVPSVLVVQTNNATFGYTAESAQQFAISRLRAIEHNRAVVHVSTVGVSGFISPDGHEGPQSTLFTPYAAVADVRLNSGLTIADRIGAAPEYAAAGGLLIAAIVSRRRRPVPDIVNHAPIEEPVRA